MSKKNNDDLYYIRKMYEKDVTLSDIEYYEERAKELLRKNEQDKGNEKLNQTLSDLELWLSDKIDKILIWGFALLILFIIILNIVIDEPSRPSYPSTNRDPFQSGLQKIDSGRTSDLTPAEARRINDVLSDKRFDGDN